MRSSRLGTASLGIAVLFLAAGAAQAGHLERPDLLQVNDTFSDTDQPAGVSAWADLDMAGDNAEGSAGITVTSGTDSAGFSGDMQDFQKASKSATRARYHNNKNTYMTAFTYNTIPNTGSSVSEVLLESCRLRITATDTTDDGVADEANWALVCGTNALADIGLSQAAQDQLILLFKNVNPTGDNAKNLTTRASGPN